MLKLKANLEGMNRAFEDIQNLFKIAGIEDFSRLPVDITEKQKFSKLFKELNKYLEPAKVQGFVWDELSYEFWDSNGNKEIYSLCFDKQVYDTLLQRYKELRRGGGGSGEGEEAYDIDPYLMALSTEKIDSDYMQSRFCKYVKSLDDQSDEETVNALLNELHRAFASLSQDQQKFANILLKDIQNHEIKVSDDKNVMELIIEYQSRAKDDQISAFARRIGVYEKKLREIMSKHPTENDINAFGQYDELIANVDIDTAKKYFDEVEGSDVPKRKVRAKLDELLRRFILEDGFDLAS